MSAVSARLSLMMFLQFFAWSSWFATLGQCLGDHGLSDKIGAAYGSAPLAAMLAPLFLGLVADRFFPSQVVMGVLMLLGGALLYVAPQYAHPDHGDTLVRILVAHMLCYMPTLGLSNTIAFSHVRDPHEFPRIRVWGTIGWIAAGLLVGYQGWSSEFHIFEVGSIASIALGLYCFTLPHTPPPARGKPADIRTLLMFDAFGMLASIPFLVFIVCSTLICIPLAYYYGYTSNLLGQVGFRQSASTMTLGQMSEIIFMLLIPFFLRRLGVKWMILVGMAAWSARYLLFAFGAPSQNIVMILAAILLHGVCYDFFFVTGFMYADKKAPPEARGQAQGMLVFFTQGIGMYFGFQIAGQLFGKSVVDYETLNTAIQTASGTPEKLNFFQSLGQMFSVALPEGLDLQLLARTMEQWKSFWLVPAGMAAIILVVFAVFFHEKKEIDSCSP